MSYIFGQLIGAIAVLIGVSGDLSLISFVLLLVVAIIGAVIDTFWLSKS